MNVSQPSREDFAALLEESLAKTDVIEGSVVKGTVIRLLVNVLVLVPAATSTLAINPRHDILGKEASFAS